MFGQMPRWKLFSIGGNPIFMEPLFLLLIAFFVFSGLNSASELWAQLLWAPILFISVLWHELGHAFALKLFGYGRSTIILQGLGGVTINDRRGLNAPPGKSILISLAGPAFSFSITLVCGAIAFFYAGTQGFDAFGGGLAERDLFLYFLVLMAFINTIWTIFNLLPINPLDGGHVVLHGLRWLYRDKRDGTRRALLHSAYSSLAVLALVVIGGFFVPIIEPMWMVILAMLFGMTNWQTIKQLS